MGETCPLAPDNLLEAEQHEEDIGDGEAERRIAAHQAADETRRSKHVVETKAVLLDRMARLREDKTQEEISAQRLIGFAHSTSIQRSDQRLRSIVAGARIFPRSCRQSIFHAT